MERLRRNANGCGAGSSDGGGGGSGSVDPGATIVGTMVQSFEALHAATAKSGHELLTPKRQGSQSSQGNQGHRPASLVSPPPTLSPSPSLSRTASPSPATQREPGSDAEAGLDPDARLGARDRRNAEPVHAQEEEDKSAVPQPAAASPNSAPRAPTPSAPSPQLQSAHNPPGTPLSPASVPDASPPTFVANTPLIRPTPSSSPVQTRARGASSTPIRPPVVRTSSTASVALSHPSPDASKRSQSGGFLGSIAVLEATAERMSMTSSIEDAIREEHNELKRSESRLSSALQASRARAASASDSDSVAGASTAAAQSGGYSPGGHSMSPRRSSSNASTRLRSGSKASSTAGMPVLSESDAGESPAAAGSRPEFRFHPRHAAGKPSTSTVASRLSLAQIAELEHPTALTQEVLDEADRAAAAAAAAGGQSDDDSTIRASAHQFIEAEFADGPDTLQPTFGHGFHDGAPPRLQLHQPDQYRHYGAHRCSDERPTTSESGTTFEQALAAFGDFDGVHCDPEATQLAPSPDLRPREPQQMRPHTAYSQRPKSYFDPVTGQQMLYYPAPVPAMLNLPPKLSKKPKVAAHNARRSQIVSAMPQASRESRAWLPDPTEGTGGELLSGDAAHRARSPNRDSTVPPSEVNHATDPGTGQGPAPGQQHGAPQSRHGTGNSNTRGVNVEGMPPQLRASAFFDLPPAIPKLEVKDGSPMATLESILDASAVVPVNAFTDHVYAGKLGAEVYGPSKKKKTKKAPAPPTPEEPAAPKPNKLVKKSSNPMLLGPDADKTRKPRKLVKKNSNASLLDPASEKKRTTRFSLFGGKRDESEDSDDGDENDGARSANNRTQSRNGRDAASPDQGAPGKDEEESGEEETEEEEVYQGPPTTLLAELQLRKQQDKMRTRPLTHMYPNGIHSTLLELNAVAEVERKARTGKRVTLAWEDPNTNPDREDEEDEDIPLGMLYAAKAAGADKPGNRSTVDISVLMSEVHRPLGLLERRELEDNEPLSRRRDRLQGKEPLSLSVMQKRMSLAPSAGGLGLRSQSRLGLPLHITPPGSAAAPSAEEGHEGEEKADDVEPEIEGETLAARKARLAAADPLPRARPVSGTFSAELLSQFGGDDDPDDKKTAGKNPGHSRNVSAVSGGDVPEEQETLGQRRRRLQLEREAREREMAASGAAAAGAASPRAPLSLADTLTAYPAGGADRRQSKTAGLRAPRPATSRSATGGFLGGGGGHGPYGNHAGTAAAYGSTPNLAMLPGAGPAGAGTSGRDGRPVSACPAAAAVGGYGLGPSAMGGASPAQIDMVERWRQGVLP